MNLTIKKLITMVITAFILLVQIAGAQQLQEGDLNLDPNDLLNLEYAHNGNGAYIQQLGNANEIKLLQDQHGLEGNLARVLQSGEANLVFIAQEGAGNQLALIQKGETNLYDLVADGNGNRIVALQKGANNSIIQRLMQSDQINSEFIQIGNDNQIVTEIQGLNNRDIRIRQEGNGLKAIIRESGF